MMPSREHWTQVRIETTSDTADPRINPYYDYQQQAATIPQDQGLMRGLSQREIAMLEEALGGRFGKPAAPPEDDVKKKWRAEHDGGYCVRCGRVPVWYAGHEELRWLRKLSYRIGCALMLPLWVACWLANGEEGP